MAHTLKRNACDGGAHASVYFAQTHRDRTENCARLTDVQRRTLSIDSSHTMKTGRPPPSPSCHATLMVGSVSIHNAATAQQLYALDCMDSTVYKKVPKERGAILLLHHARI